MESVLYFENKKYILVKQAALLTDYSKDYVSQLCRQKKVDSRRVGNVWYVSEDSLTSYKDTPSNFDFSKNFKPDSIKKETLSNLKTTTPVITTVPNDFSKNKNNWHKRTRINPHTNV